MTPAPEVLVDTSVWIEHFRRGSAPLAELLAGDAVRMHPLVLLELACGSPPAPRARTLADLARLRPAPQAGQPSACWSAWERLDPENTWVTMVS